MNTNDPVDRLSELVVRAHRASDEYTDTDSRIEALEEALDAALAVLDSVGIELAPKTYKINRCYFSDDYAPETVKTGLTLDEAQAHCNDPETSSTTCTSAEGLARTEERGPWFDSYTDESR